MAKKYCDDCGCGLRNGICSNCDEEAYIVEFQGEFIEEPLSEEFQQKAEEGFARASKRQFHGISLVGK